MDTSDTKHHLLVVDDNETNRRVAQAILEHLGYVTSFAGDGIEALSAVQNGIFSLVLMDCHMPVMDGFAATESIRCWEKNTARMPTPIVAVSASDFQEDRDRCIAVGMNDFIAKPLTLVSLQSMLDRWLPMLVTTAATAKSMSDSQPGGNQLPEHLFDRVQFEEMQMLTGDRFHPLLEQFCVDGLLQINCLRQVIASNDAEAVRKCVHKLKGSSATIGAKMLFELCHRMEERARAGDLQNADEAIDTIAACLGEVAAVIHSL